MSFPEPPLTAASPGAGGDPRPGTAETGQRAAAAGAKSARSCGVLLCSKAA